MESFQFGEIKNPNGKKASPPIRHTHVGINKNPGTSKKPRKQQKSPHTTHPQTRSKSKSKRFPWKLKQHPGIKQITITTMMMHIHVISLVSLLLNHLYILHSHALFTTLLQYVIVFRNCCRRAV